MPWFASEEDRLTASALEQWQEIAAEEVDDINGWRDDHTRKIFPQARHGNGEPKFFFGHTATIVGWIARKLPSLDPEPIQKIYAAINAWYTDWNADRIPHENELEAILSQAVIVTSAAREEIRSRSSRHPPGELTTPAEQLGEAATLTDPLPANGQFPPDDGWHFEPGVFWFRGKRYELTPKPLDLLRAFLGPRSSLGMDDLRNALDPNQLGQPVTDDNIRMHLGGLRKILRVVAEDIGAEESIRADPLPYSRGGWQFLLPRQ